MLENPSKAEFFEFLGNAHRHINTAPDEIREAYKSNPSLWGHKSYSFVEGDWNYRNEYAGNFWTSGSEIVFHKGQPFWRMNYQGKTSDDMSIEFYDKEVIPFLRRALLQAPSDLPIRGPKKLEEENMTYFFDMDRDWTHFRAKEYVLINDPFKFVFSQDITGSLIK